MRMEVWSEGRWWNSHWETLSLGGEHQEGFLEEAVTEPRRKQHRERGREGFEGHRLRMHGGREGGAGGCPKKYR